MAAWRESMHLSFTAKPIHHETQPPEAPERASGDKLEGRLKGVTLERRCQAQVRGSDNDRTPSQEPDEV